MRAQKREILLVADQTQLGEGALKWLSANGWELFGPSPVAPELVRYVKHAVPVDQYEAWTEAPPFVGSMAAFTRHQIAQRKCPNTLKTRRFEGGRFTSVGFLL